MTDQAQAVEDVHERMMAQLGEEETPPDLEEPEDEEAIETADDDAETEEAEEAEAEEEATEEITHNGEVKVLTKSQMKELAQQGFDYTQKTQAVAEERRSIQAQAQMLQVQSAIHTQLADVAAEVKSIDKQIAQYKQVDWGTLIEQDPVQAMKLNQTLRELKEAREERVQEYNTQANHFGQVQAQSQAQMKDAELKLLAQKVPDLTGPKAAESQAALIGYLSAEGFSDAEVTSIMDHRMLAVAWKAAQYDKLKAGKPEIQKRVAEAPKVVKAKQPANQKASVNRDLRDKLRKSGDANLAAKLIEQML